MGEGDRTAFQVARQAVSSGAKPEAAAAELVAAMTEDERLWCLDGDVPAIAGLQFLADDGYHQAPFPAARVERLGLPGFAFSDGPRGAVIGNATCFPVPMARGATWDLALEERVGQAIGRELRALGADLTGAVCINLLRHPAWGRAQETYGEDPYHVGEMGAALTRGLQRHVMACVKHLAVNSMENARFTVDVEVDDVALHEVYLPHFKRVVDEGVAAVMSAYNSVNGEWAGQNHDLLTTVLRREWGFRGFVISDWILGLRDAALSVSAGLDVEMPWRMLRRQQLPKALEEGRLAWADVDAAVTRVVATLLRFDAVLSAAPPGREVVGSLEHRALAREVATRSMVLLKNDPVEGRPVLPLAPSVRVAVIGRLASRVNVGDGGSSDVWDLGCRTVLDGLNEIFEVLADDGADAPHAALVAGRADAAVVVVGYTYEDEGEFIGELSDSVLPMLPPRDEPDVAKAFADAVAQCPETGKPVHVRDRTLGFARGGDRCSLRLRGEDVELVKAVAAVNPRTVVVLQAGSAVVVEEWLAAVPAVVQAWYGGAEAGPALAEVLCGAAEPSGRLPFSVPSSEEDLPAFDRDATSVRYDQWHGWWHLRRIGATARFPFGFGLGYTTFALDDVTARIEGEHVLVRGVLRNTGRRRGSDVIQVYAELPGDEAPSRLIGFVRVDVDAGASQPIELSCPLARLARRDPGSRSWRPAQGEHVLRVGRHAADPQAVVLQLRLDQ